MAPPPVSHARWSPFHVSLPGSPGAGMTYLRHSSLPVVASSPAAKSRVPRSPPDAPMKILSLVGIIGAVIHQPVLRLAVGIDQPIRRDVACLGPAGDGSDRDQTSE